MPPLWARYSDTGRRRLLAVAMSVLGGVVAWLLLSGCASIFRQGLRLSCHGIDEGRVRGWVSFVEAKSGRIFGDFRLTVNATITGHEAWAPSLGRNVGVIREASDYNGMAAGTRGTSKSGHIRIALATDGFFPEGYGQHEMAHALAASLYGKVDLPATWKGWVPYWHP